MLVLLNNNNLPGQFCAPSAFGFSTIPLLTLLKMCPRAQRTFLALNFRKILGRTFF